MDTPTPDVVIYASVENMAQTIEYRTIPRAYWDAMTPAERRELLETFGSTTMSNAGGYGYGIESGAPDEDLDDPTPPTQSHDQAHRQFFSDRIPILYRVKADRDDYDTFSEAIVFADDPEDAIRIVEDHIALGDKSEAPGHWLAPHLGARLTATEIEHVRGPVLGHGVPS